MTPEELRAQVEAKLAEMEPETKEELKKEHETPSETTDSEQNHQVEDKHEFAEDSIEAEAIKMGWNPDHQGPNKKSAEQFVKDGSFFRKIDAQNKKIDDLLKVVKGLDEHTQKLQKSAIERERIGYEKALRDLQIKRAEAVEEGDVNKFHQTEAELAELNKAAPVKSIEKSNITQEMKDWADENKSWFNLDNKRIVRECDGLYTLEKEDHPNMSDKELLEIVKQKIQILHPEKFENPNKSKPAVTLKPKASSSSGYSSGLESKLTERQLNFYKTAKAAGVKMSIQDYAKQLEINGDLRND